MKKGQRGRVKKGKASGDVKKVQTKQQHRRKGVARCKKWSGGKEGQEKM